MGYRGVCEQRVQLHGCTGATEVCPACRHSLALWRVGEAGTGEMKMSFAAGAPRATSYRPLMPCKSACLSSGHWGDKEGSGLMLVREVEIMRLEP